jgi:hypothetical protein
VNLSPHSIPSSDDHPGVRPGILLPGPGPDEVLSTTEKLTGFTEMPDEVTATTTPGSVIQSISLRDLDPSEGAGLADLRHALTKEGIVIVEDIPGFGAARTRALADLAACLQAASDYGGHGRTGGWNAVDLTPGVRRQTIGATTERDMPTAIEDLQSQPLSQLSACVSFQESAEIFRAAVHSASGTLVRALDAACSGPDPTAGFEQQHQHQHQHQPQPQPPPQRSRSLFGARPFVSDGSGSGGPGGGGSGGGSNASGPVSYASVAALVRHGRHLEHFHLYAADRTPPSPSPAGGPFPEPRPVAMEAHVDAGLFIAMAPALLLQASR